MNFLLLYILIASIAPIIFMIVSKPVTGSDHAYHVRLIDSIKRNNNKFLKTSSISLNEANLPYPQLFHWILSFWPEKIYKKQYLFINISIKLIEIVAFNLFLSFLYQKRQFDLIVFLYANIIVNIFPISYAVWNAKNTGLSTRGIGLVLGQLYTYFIVVYVLTDNIVLLLPLFAVTFISILLSQMATQFVLLSLPFFVVFFKIPEIILLPFLSFALFYVIMPQIAKNYIVGQFNHKRNYFLFLADIFILKSRPSIYRDFVYDFWVKLKKNLVTGIAYFYFNPIIEIIYGIPFLWFVLYVWIQNQLKEGSDVIFSIVLSALGVFFLTSFRWTRFLGEPQRYLEFVIPLITILYVINFDLTYHILLVSFSLFFILIGMVIIKKNVKKQAKKSNRNILINYLETHARFKNNLCVSNDNDLLKYLPAIGINTISPDLTIFYKNRENFTSYFNDNYRELSFKAVSEYVNKFDPDLLIINSTYYDFETLKSNIHLKKNLHIIDLNEYSLYEIT